MRKKQRKRHEKDLISATNVLQKLLEGQNIPLSHAFLVWKLGQHWKDVVGDSICQHTQPLFYMRGTLFIGTENSAWIQELIFFQNTIKKKINTYLGMDWVKSLRFQPHKND